MIRANLLHLSYNMWGDWDNPDPPSPYHVGRPYLRFDESLWDELTTAMMKARFNMVIIDLGDGVRYDSHPEIAVEGAWTPLKLREELKALHAMGLEPIPKLNFSTAHDRWLGPYARMVSTPKYYDVCRELIAEVCDLFDKPRFFHLGMDEENEGIQRKLEYSVIRQHGLWWRDLKFYCEQVERNGVRPWVWSDYVWAHPEAFYANMPKTVLQSNWHYKADWAPASPRVKDFIELDKAGYEQVPTLSNWYAPEPVKQGVDFCREHISKERLLGFMMTAWRPTLPETRERHIEAIELLAKALG